MYSCIQTCFRWQDTVKTITDCTPHCHFHKQLTCNVCMLTKAQPDVLKILNLTCIFTFPLMQLFPIKLEKSFCFNCIQWCLERWCLRLSWKKTNKKTQTVFHVLISTILIPHQFGDQRFKIIYRFKKNCLHCKCPWAAQYIGLLLLNIFITSLICGVRFTPLDILTVVLLDVC